MKHWHWVSLAFLAVILGAVAAAVPRLGGAPSSEPAYAHIITAEPTTSPTPGAPAFHAEIDADVSDGSPCNPVDSTANVDVGDTNDVAVCLTSAMAPVAGPPTNGVAKIQFDVIYNPQLNSCANPDCDPGTTGSKCVDDMPDLNDGTTLGQGDPTSPDIGGGWDCSGFGTTQPSCTGGTATIGCGTLAGPFPPTGPAISFPIFAVTFTAIAGGDDDLSLANVATYDKPGAALGSCNPTLFGEPELLCFGVTVSKSGPTPQPTPTATATRTPTATSTPCPDGICPTEEPTRRAWTKTPTPTSTGTPVPSEPGEPGEPPPPPPPTSGQAPTVVPPATGSGPDGTAWASTAVWLLAAAGAISISLGGSCLRRAGHR
ncbi:MAG: hypothetical protein A2Y74_04175 [Actinobacteria bacterium RBG_13_63_9]|nr:MAG: hypothetical protein A2Y74_04175 [Actinobacteria bacterium RBG_13_63_9]